MTPYQDNIVSVKPQLRKGHKKIVTKESSLKSKKRLSNHISILNLTIPWKGRGNSIKITEVKLLSNCLRNMYKKLKRRGLAT